MDRDSGTPSSLIWQVERLLTECKELGNLPDILQMENVTECHNYKNKSNFEEWTYFLEGLGYTNYLADLNAADYLVPQHRERAIMISLLGNYNYKFPLAVQLDTCMADYLEDEVEDKLFIKSEKALNLILKLENDGTLPIEDCENSSIHKMGFIEKGSGEHQSNQVYGKDGQSPTIPAIVGDKTYLNIVDEKGVDK